MPEPSKIPQAWAELGDYNTIPLNDPGNGMASWNMGFPVETQTPLAAGGVPPRRQDINGALYWLSLGQLWNQQGGLWQYDASENYEIGNVVEQNNALYYCKAANGPNGTVKSPSADTAGTYWKKLVNADGTLNVPVISNASTTVKGIVELATSAETKALSDSTRAVTPNSLNGLLSLSPSALTVPKADSNAKLTGWLDALKDNDGRVNISIKGTAPQLQTARSVQVNLASASAANFNGTTNITPGVTGVLPIANGGTGTNYKSWMDLTTVQTATATKRIKGHSKGWSVYNDDESLWSAFIMGSDNIGRGIMDSVYGWVVLSNTYGSYFLGRADEAVALHTPRSIQTNLASTTSVSFDGTANVTPGVTGTLAVNNGGTGQTDLDLVTVGKAKQLNTARTFRTNLSSTSAVSFNGTANVSPGVTGTLAVTNGGTGKTDLDLVIVGKAKALNTARSIRTNLASTSATNFDGTANVTPGVTGVLGVSNGGTGQSNLDLVTVGKAKALNTARAIQTNLSSATSASFDGTANVTPGVTGVLPIANGGTGTNYKSWMDLTTVQMATATKRIKGHSKGWSVYNDDESLWSAFIMGSDNIGRGIRDSQYGWTYLADEYGVHFYGEASRAVKFTTPRSFVVNLGSTTAASFDGSVDVSPGVSGTLGVGNGGTGQTNLDLVTVGKAKQLNTARAINGTNFDGTSSITTAQWGTARNVNISDATQTNTGATTSVNGSAAVTLKLPATIKAALNGNADTATKLQTARTINGTPFDGTASIIAMESSDRNLAQNGYIRFQSGLLVQWGHTLVTNNTNNVVSFSVAFDTVFTVNATMQLVSGIGAGGSYTHISINSFNTTDFSVKANIEGGGAQIYINWIAIGK